MDISDKRSLTPTKPQNLSTAAASLAGRGLRDLQKINEWDLICQEDKSLLWVIVFEIPHKMLQHFLNFAKPNAGLQVDELVAFCICFTVIDLSWRLKEGFSPKHLLTSLYSKFGSDIINSYKEYCDLFVGLGFSNCRRDFTLEIIATRTHMYQESYSHDREAEDWIYKYTLELCINNCLTTEALNEATDFSELLGDVIDGARGRVKKKFRHLSDEGIARINTFR